MYHILRYTCDVYIYVLPAQYLSFQLMHASLNSQKTLERVINVCQHENRRCSFKQMYFVDRKKTLNYFFLFAFLPSLLHSLALLTFSHRSFHFHFFILFFLFIF